jgi:hypothetical protein
VRSLVYYRCIEGRLTLLIRPTYYLSKKIKKLKN